MFSKRLVAVVTGIIVLISCAGEDKPKQVIPVIRSKSAGGCLSGSSAAMSAYWQGKLNDKQIGEFWGCIQSAIVAFEKYAEGQTHNRFTAVEIRDFLQSYFLDDTTRINNTLLGEFMRVKRLLIKGSEKHFTRREVKALKTLMEKFKAMSITLAPYIKVLSKEQFAAQAKTPEGQKLFTEARTAFGQVFGKFGELLKNNNEAYDLNHLSTLFKELEVLLNDPQQETTFDLSNYIPLLIGLKGALITQPAEQLGATDYPLLMETLNDLLFTMLGSKYYFEPTDWDHDHGLAALDNSAKAIFGIFEKSLKRQPDNSISFAELGNIIDALEQLKMLPLGLTAEATKKTAVVLIQKVFKSDADPKPQAFNMAVLGAIAKEWKGYITSQQFAMASLQTGKWDDSKGVEANLQLMRAADSGIPLEKDAVGRLIIKTSRPADWFWDRKSLTALNWQRSLIRLLVIGYTTDPSRGFQGLTRDELQVAAKDFYEMGVAVGFFPKNKPNLYKRIFQEANLFMPRSNGDDLIDFEEGTEYLAYSLSGVAARNEFLKQTQSACPVTMIDDNRTLDTLCFREQFFNNKVSFLANLPEFLTDVDGKEKPYWDLLTGSMERAVRKKNFNLSERITASEIAQFLIVGHYIETFMTRFDKPETQIIDLPKSMVAYKVYKPILKELVGGFMTDDADIEALYTFMFRYGTTPLSGMDSMVRFMNWKLRGELGQWQYDADRARLSQILAELSDLSF